MDPITAFSLAAGVLQVIDLSLKALSKCRETYRDGSLAEHQSTGELTTDLGISSRSSDPKTCSSN